MKKSKMVRLCMALLVSCLFMANTTFADQGVDVGVDTAKMMKMIQDLQQDLVDVQKDNAAMKKDNAKLEAELNTLRDVEPKVVKDTELANQVKGLQREIQTLKSQKAAPVVVPEVPTGNVPAWLNGTHFGGDMRVRMQTDSNSGSDKDRIRGRFRLRYGISKQVNEELKAGFVMATGDSSTQTDEANRRSSAVTMGGTANGFDKYSLWLDQAYLQYKPNALQTDDLNITFFGGKFKENWKHKGILIHPEAVGFDGFGQSIKYDLGDGLKADFNMAQLFISESSGEDGDSEMYVFDAGIKGAEDGFTWGLRGTSYIFAGYNDGGSAALGGGGDYRTVVGTADLGFDLGEVPVAMFAQYGKNMNDEAAGATSPGADKYWAVGITFDKLRNPGDWNFGYKFAYLEENVIPSGLPDADLVGGREAHWLYANYRLFSSTDLNVTAIIPRTLSDSAASDGETDSLLVKFNFTTKF